MTSMFLVILGLSAMGATQAQAEQGANPIRKIVTLLQNMQKEIEAEGAKEQELFDKFMCFCSGNNADLTKKATDAKAAIEELSAKLKSEEAEKVQIALDLLAHKADRAGATTDIEEATMLREKEAAAFATEKADSETNIGQMATAIPALEKGMGGAALLQVPGTDRIKKIVEAYPNVDAND